MLPLFINNLFLYKTIQKYLELPSTKASTTVCYGFTGLDNRILSYRLAVNKVIWIKVAKLLIVTCLRFTFA